MSRSYIENIYIELQDCYLLKVQYKNEYIDSYIDKDDYKKVKQKHWRTSHKKNKIYLVTGKSGNSENPLTYIHNYILNYIPIAQQEVDHIDGNSCNNRKSNLRIVSRQQNIDNTRVRIDNKIGIRGICQDKKTLKFKCDFSYHGKRYYFKDSNTLEEAVYIRKVAEEYFGIETLKNNPLSKQYLDKLSEEKKKEIYDYVINKIS